VLDFYAPSLSAARCLSLRERREVRHSRLSALSSALCPFAWNRRDAEKREWMSSRHSLQLFVFVGNQLVENVDQFSIFNGVIVEHNVLLDSFSTDNDKSVILLWR
jgi:hypothetical protein